MLPKQGVAGETEFRGHGVTNREIGIEGKGIKSIR